ncbi:MAG: hypothetical protein JRJ84_12040 [Deltaproteobacteria bacterium]|nr:hypothetical protein [Deltaproteobacteria bacterium]
MSDSGTATTPQADQSEGTAGKEGRADLLSALTPEQLKLAYRVAVRSRVVEEHIVRLVSRGEVKFAIWGPGEEVHGAATALALHRVVNPEHFALVPHYRSGCLCSTWCTLNGFDDFSLYLLRQQFSRDTDVMSRGRQMVQHVHLPEYGILPVQSPVGMQLGKVAGHALGQKVKGFGDAVAMAVVGDGTTAEGDMHEAMNAASVWQLPVIILITDNGIAISTPPEDGRGIRDFRAYAEGFGFAHFEADGRDFEDVYTATVAAATYVKEQQRPCLFHVHSLPRFNGHSSAADVTFDLNQDDPLIAFGTQLVEKGILAEDDVLRRIEGKGRDFFAHHDLGRIMTEEDVEARALLEQVRKEPEPPPESVFEHIYGPFPKVEETAPGEGTTRVTYGGAIRSALDKLISRKNGFLLGQDVAQLGGVMQASAGLLARHPDRVVDTPLNEPLIVGVSFGLGLYGDIMALPEIQFSDYSLNTLHWLVHLGNLRWATAGNAYTKVVLRMPTDPFGGGAMYHSMSMDGFYAGGVPGAEVDVPADPWPGLSGRVDRPESGPGPEEADHARRGARPARRGRTLRQGRGPADGPRPHPRRVGSSGMDLTGRGGQAGPAGDLRGSDRPAHPGAARHGPGARFGGAHRTPARRGRGPELRWVREADPGRGGGSAPRHTYPRPGPEERPGHRPVAAPGGGNHPHRRRRGSCRGSARRDAYWGDRGLGLDPAPLLHRVKPRPTGIIRRYRCPRGGRALHRLPSLPRPPPCPPRPPRSPAPPRPRSSHRRPFAGHRRPPARGERTARL